MFRPLGVCSNQEKNVCSLQIENNGWRVHAYHVFILKQPSASNQNGDDLARELGKGAGPGGLGGFSQPS